MEIRWIEDFLAVANMGHFARAAEQRNVTQSALSRRIQSLEQWSGAELLDRSSHPITLTEAGRQFSDYARIILEKSFEARGVLKEMSALSERSATISCLHTLSLNFMPDLITQLNASLPPFATSIVAETRTIEEYLNALANGTSDFFVCYGHPSVPLDISAAKFPKLKIGAHVLAPYQSAATDPVDLDMGKKPIPYLEYLGTSFMSRVVSNLIDRATFKQRLESKYRVSLAEGLAAACRNGLGVAWLPDTVLGEQPEYEFRRVSDRHSLELDIYLYWSADSQRQIVQDIVGVLTENASFDMRAAVCTSHLGCEPKLSY